jgi:predicted acyl esterase
MHTDAQDPTIIENAWIRMSDGTALAAQIWLPADANEQPVPAILEYIPYRKRDHKYSRDAQNHGYFARHGYAGVRVDLRGSGDSEGILRGEYLQQELDDGLEVLQWIAAQTWCSGKVGLFGLSWGGFNALQLAALSPPEVGAIVTVCSTDDRYADDVHYMGGCLLTDNLSWAATMFGFNSCPPDPAIVGERWRTMWLDRLEGSGLWLKDWLEHQQRDPFWTHGSVCEDYSSIKVPVFAVSGWADGYSNAVFRLLKNLSVPRWGLVGYWGHRYPHMGAGPTVDFLGECLRFWERWLKGVDTGIEDEPQLRVWMQDTTNPMLPGNPGRWVAEEAWPSANIEDRSLALGHHELLEGPPDAETALTVQSPLSCGLFAGKWCSYSETTDLPWDQRADDGGALIFDTAPLSEPVEILGMAEAELELSADKPVAMVAIRLCDVGPSGRATRVTFGVLNLTHRDGHTVPDALECGKRYRVRVGMNDVAQRFPAGHRIRLAISSSYWPLTWPSPEAARLTLYTAGSRLSLPVRPPSPLDDQLRPLGTGSSDPAPNTTMLAPAERTWIVEHNLASNQVSLRVTNNDPRIRLDDIDMVIGRNVVECYSYHSNRYDTIRAEASHERIFARGDWRVLTKTTTVLTSTRTQFVIRATLDAFEGDVRVYSKSWDEAIPRRGV